jgi:hypothetical protein
MNKERIVDVGNPFLVEIGTLFVRSDSFPLKQSARYVCCFSLIIRVDSGCKLFIFADSSVIIFVFER